MNSYDVFYDSLLGKEFVKDGWSWPAFFFTYIWAFTKKLWLHAFIALISFITVELVIIFAFFPNAVIINFFFILVGLILEVIFGFKGNNWVFNKLNKEGYEIVTSVMASSKSDASFEFSLWEKKQKEKSKSIEQQKKLALQIEKEKQTDNSIDASALTKLEKLGELKSKGILTDEEFQNEKKKLLERN
jgi:hypothetical protein